MEKKSFAYVIMGLGILSLLKYMGVPLGNLFNYMIGAGLLLGYLQTTRDGQAKTWLMVIGVFFITKGVLNSVNTSFLLKYVDEFISPFLTGLGFYSIYVIGEQTSHAHDKSFEWAKRISKFFFFIGTIVLVFSLFGFAVGFVFKHFWPIVLISLGLSMLVKNK